MNKLKLNLSNVKEVLTREQLKQIIGGMGSGEPMDAPSDPTGSDPYEDGESTGYRCCWDNQPNNCSACVAEEKPDWMNRLPYMLLSFFKFYS